MVPKEIKNKPCGPTGKRIWKKDKLILAWKCGPEVYLIMVDSWATRLMVYPLSCCSSLALVSKGKRKVDLGFTIGGFPGSALTAIIINITDFFFFLSLFHFLFWTLVTYPLSWRTGS